MTYQTKAYKTREQSILAAELVAAHGLDPEQINFDGDELTPIFDYTAISLLSLKLTDIQSIDCQISDRNLQMNNDLDRAPVALSGFVTGRASITMPDGRVRSVEASAWIGELLPNLGRIDTVGKCESVAQSRATRLCIRSVGINLLHAHREFVKTGRIATGSADIDPRNLLYKEIHQLAENLELIVDGDKSEYRSLLAVSFEGRESTVDLSDLELQRFAMTLRTLDRVRRSRDRSATAAA